MNIALTEARPASRLDRFAGLTAGKGLLVAVFFASLLLSCIALRFDPVIARDASLYIDIAQLAANAGVEQARGQFDWPWFPILLGLLHKASGLGLEGLAHLLCELFTALTCVLVVDLLRKIRPHYGGWTALAVLALPAFNDYRGDIIRENGFWCFSFLALWAIMRWDQHRRLCWLLLSVLAVCLGCAFRLEAVCLLGSFILFVALRVSGTRASKLWAVAVIAVLFAAIGALLVMALRADLLPGNRVAYYVSQLDASRLIGGFQSFVGQVAAAMPQDYARDDAGQILTLGIAGYFVVRVAGCMGLLLLPFCVGVRIACGDRARPWLLLDLAALAYASVLLLFLFSNLFLSQRYLVLLELLLLPRMVQGLSSLAVRWPRSLVFLVVVLLLQALANVVTFSAPKTQLRDAGYWVGGHLQATDKVYTEDKRVKYYAGWRVGLEQLSREEALSRHGDEAFQFFVLDLKRHPEEQIAVLGRQGLEPIVQFRNAKGDTSGVFRRSRP
jgi:hypothetical protein